MAASLKAGFGGDGEFVKFDSHGRRSWSPEQRRRIVAEALGPGVSVAAVAHRHGVNANLVFKWIRRAREGWRDRRKADLRREGAVVDAVAGVATFIPVQVIDATSIPAPSAPAGVGKETRSVKALGSVDARLPLAPLGRRPDDKRSGRRGVMEIGLPNGARIRVDADVEEAALRLVLSAMKAL